MKSANTLTAISLLLAMAAASSAQSHDPARPAPMGPGVNKGNVDNKQNGPNYYYFYAGPGHVDLHYAFREMGVFGNPFRQALSFDLYDDSNKLITHDAIISVDKMEKLSRADDLAVRRKLLLRVISPSTALRLGGYYEIEITGAATFEGNATGANVKPEDTALYHSGGPLYKAGAELYKSGGVALYKGGAVDLYRPVGALIKVQESPNELRLTLAADVLFDFDAATVRPDAQAALDRVAEIIRTKSQGMVRIEGFTDSKGTAAYNLRLSRMRAESVERWLNDRERLRGTVFSSRGFGATRFVAPNTKPDGSDDSEGRQKNRRVEIIVQKRD